MMNFSNGLPYNNSSSGVSIRSKSLDDLFSYSNLSSENSKSTASKISFNLNNNRINKPQVSNNSHSLDCGEYTITTTTTPNISSSLHWSDGRMCQQASFIPSCDTLVYDSVVQHINQLNIN